MRSKRCEIVGYVDHAGGGLVQGWAADLRAPGSRLALDVFRRGVYLGCARAGAPREDLRAQGIGDGRYGFVFHSPALADIDASDGLDIVATDMRRTRLTVSGAAVPAPCSTDRVADVRSFFGPLLAAIAAAPTGDVESSQAAPHRAETLFAPHAVSETGHLSAFAAHIAAKYDRPATADQSFWPWYLGVYGVEQAFRVPLSASDLDHLRRMSFAGPDQRVGLWALFGRTARRYGWCVHESRRLKIEDCLADPAAVRTLASVPWMSRHTAFPLSQFMRLLCRRHWLLRRYSTTTAEDRITVYAIVMLLAVHDAHYLRLMPAHWLDRMLEAGLFERTQHGLFGRQTPVLSKHRYRAHLRAIGFDLSARRFTTIANRGHRSPVARRPMAGGPVDVQMIGPFRQSLGLAESCRRIACALQATGLAVNFVDYRIGTSGILSSQLPTQEIREARVNILHVNAEEVPEAMAAYPCLLNGARTVVVPYWELDRPSAAHRLGLQLVDEVWCTSRFLAGVFEATKPVRHIGMSFDDRDAPSTRWASGPLDAQADSDGFTVLCVADALSWLQRKNVLGAIDAFQTAFHEDVGARLIVKMRNTAAAADTPRAGDWRAVRARCDGDPRIRILDTDLEPRAQRALLAGVDCLLSLHRAEGLGLDILDAMHLGTPVVATAYSGNMDVCTDETAWLVDFELTQVAPGHYAFVEPGQCWAEPNLASAADALRAVRSDPIARARKTANARAYVTAHASPARLSARLAELLRDRLAAT